MKHRFKNTCYDVRELLDGCTTLAMFMRRVTAQSKDAVHSWKWDEMTYRGDAFEALVEVLINASPIDKRINIIGYSPWDIRSGGSDMGVDGTGTSHNGKAHTVQIKFRTNVAAELTANMDHISNFVAKSMSMYRGQEIDMTIFTTANGLSEPINEGMYHGQVRTLGFKEIGKLINGNDSFWAIFRREMGVV